MSAVENRRAAYVKVCEHRQRGKPAFAGLLHL